MLNRLPRSPLTAEQDRVRTRWCTESELIEGEDLTAGFEDTLLSSLREAQRGDAEFGHLEEPDVVGHCADVDDDFRVAVGCALGFFCNFGEREGGPVCLGEVEAVEDCLGY